VTTAKKIDSGGALRLKDVLRADVPAIYRALADSNGADGLVRRTYRFVHWLEQGGKRNIRTYLVTPLPLLWAWKPDDGSWTGNIHNRYLRELWRERGFLGRAWLLISLLWWLPMVLALVLWSTWLNGGATRLRSGKGVARQMWEQVRCAARFGMLPVWYYMFEMFDADQQKKAPHYIHRYELKSGLLHILRRSVPVARRTPTQKKAAFLRLCAKADIPTLSNIAIFTNGKLQSGGPEWNGAWNGLPPRDLFVKPARGRGGEGAGLWCWTGAGYQFQGGRMLSPQALLAHLAELSKERAMLVQPRVRNHAGLRDLSNGALCTARIVTLRNESGGHEAVCALFRMAVGDNRLVDNFHAGGIAAPIDVATGRLGAATDWGLRPRHGWRTHHPDTGGIVEGRILPLWAETRALAERAHASFADRHIIGWDMAILEDGPHIVEANGGPDTDMHQRVSREPLGNQRFGELMAFHLGKA
jgi:hypothetical protein